jgi:4-hydroxybenzoate polyprenyltransferase
MRPRQWLKNGLVYAALFFDRQAIDLDSLARATAAFVLLCMVSSAVYIMNDLVDVENDRQHPRKKNRPIAAGELRPTVAMATSIVLAILGLVGGFLLSQELGWILAAYLLLQAVYTFYFKHVVLVDVIIVATGFILRVAAGVAVIQVERFSPWLYVCTGLLALVIALGRRRHEISLLGEDAGNHRAILDEYNLELIDRLIDIVAAAALVAYSLYTFMAEGLPRNNLMMLTIPFALYGIFRYLFLIHVRQEGGAPEEIFIRDRPMQLTLILWAAVVYLVLYVVE